MTSSGSPSPFEPIRIDIQSGRRRSNVESGRRSVYAFPAYEASSSRRYSHVGRVTDGEGRSSRPSSRLPNSCVDPNSGRHAKRKSDTTRARAVTAAATGPFCS